MRKRLMSVNPQTLQATPSVFFELRDGEVHIEYASDDARWGWQDYLSELPHPSGRLVKPSEGLAYWERLEINFSESTFVYVDVEPMDDSASVQRANLHPDED